MSQKIVLASNNAGKLKEFSALLGPFGFNVLPQGELGIPETEEPHVTFIENALAKARHAARLSGLPALADDSGLVVPCLGGAPGVYSARYGGEPKSDARNNAKLLQELAPHSDRRAHYVCVLAYVRQADDPQPLFAEAEWHGEILQKEQGSGGFGYDPLFYISSAHCSVAEMPSVEKNKLSHRAQAMRLLAARLFT